MSETPHNTESEPSKRGPDETASKNLDDLNDPKNAELADKFRADFSNKITGNTLELVYNKSSVEYKYLFKINGNGTVTITKTNESELKEKLENNLPAPAPHVAEVSFMRLYANQVFGMPELGNVLGIAEEEPEGGKRKWQIEAGVAIPKFSESETTAEQRYGAEANVRFYLTDPDKSYIAVRIPFRGIYERGIGKGKNTVYAGDAWRLSAGAGLEAGWKPAEWVAFYGGVDVSGKFTYARTVEVVKGLTSIQINPAFATVAGATAGARVNPTERWHLYASVNPEVRLASEVSGDVLLTGGTGVLF